jgi:hypothetical protein
MRLDEAAGDLVGAAVDPSATIARMTPFVERFFSLPQPSIEEAERAMAVLAEGVAGARGEGLAALANIAGCLVERGLRPGPLVEPLLAQVTRAARLARPLLDAAVARVPGDADDGQIEAARVELAASMPEQAAAWAVLEKLFGPSMAKLPAELAGAADVRAAESRTACGAHAGEEGGAGLAA